MGQDKSKTWEHEIHAKGYREGLCEGWRQSIDMVARIADGDWGDTDSGKAAALVLRNLKESMTWRHSGFIKGLEEASND